MLTGRILLLALPLMTAPAQDSSPAPKDPPLIPRRVLFGNPDRAAVRVSHDGKRISFVAPVAGVLNIWVAPAADPGAAEPLTRDEKRGITQYFWAHDNERIVYLQDKGGDENWRVYALEVASGKVQDLTPLEGVAARIQQVSPKFPDEILVAINDRVPQLHDIHRVDLRTGKRTLVRENDGQVAFVTDDDYRVRFAWKTTPDGGTEFVEITPDGATKPFATVGLEDALSTRIAGFDATGNVLYMTESRGRDTAALVARDLTTGKTTVLGEDPRSDIAKVLSHPTEKRIEAVCFQYERERWTILDPVIGRCLEHLRTVSPGEVDVLSRTRDDRRWIVAFHADDGPVRYFLYDRSADGSPGRARFLFTNRTALEGLPLAKMNPVVIESRDGLELVSYLTLPAGLAPEGPAAPSRPLPLVLFVHGGPWARDSWGFHPYHQWLANRGYAVLSVNFRGSTGFGKRFLNAGNLEWGRKMHDDLLDAVDWAVDRKLADRARVAIMGGSYGGYATLVGLTFTPDVFACGVDIVGPSSIVTLIERIPPYWVPQVAQFKMRAGDPTTEEGRKFLESRSPLTFVDRIAKPLLIGQGANDPRVKQSESDQIVAAMREKRIPVTYVLFPDEGHGFVRPENNLAFSAVAEGFLATHLGGRAEPVGDDFKGSSIEVPEGAGHVPGILDPLGAK
jgi:dipeptidyl aminopeptidase/acylaminoacyl peptidase